MTLRRTPTYQAAGPFRQRPAWARAAAIALAALGSACSGEPADTADGPGVPSPPAVGRPAADDPADAASRGPVPRAPVRRAQAVGPPALTALDDWPAATHQGLLNGSFELLTDATTAPPKYGAYWLGAFAAVEGDPTDLVEQRDDAALGRRVLVLPADGTEVLQKIVADARFGAELVVELAWRPRGAAGLSVALVDGPGRRTAVLREATGSDAPGGWIRERIELGRLFTAEHGAGPTPRLQLVLAAVGDEPDASVEVDDVSATITLATPSARQLATYVLALVRWTLDAWFLPPEQGGLGLVDPATGYVVAKAYDVESGTDLEPTRSVSFHTIHNLLVLWLRLAEERGWQGEVDRWTPELARITTTLLAHHFHPGTGLPRTVDRESGEPLDDVPTTVGSYVEFLVDAQEVLPPGDLRDRCGLQIRRIADTLLALQAEHDLDPKRVFNDAKLNPDTGVFEGTYPNWFGHIPNRLTPEGAIDTPRRYNTAWAIVKERDFWYHFFKSPAAIMAAHALAPGEGDLKGVRRTLTRYHRDWDASRYDLENDTDDHYGYLCEDLMTVLRHSEGEMPRALELVQQATDHRLSREGAVDDTLWIQAARLGTACAGDSPRAHKGVLDLYQLPPTVNPLSSGLPLYREALLELAANDFKGRQLTNGQFTESFFKDWEMVCICYRGTYQGDCREHPADYWHGDVGDIFGGPPMQSIECQSYALQVAADDDERAAILARLATILWITESTLRRPYGYEYGLDPEIARQYDLPERYTVGLDPRTTRGLGYVMSWMKVLPHLAAD